MGPRGGVRGLMGLGSVASLKWFGSLHNAAMQDRKKESHFPKTQSNPKVAVVFASSHVGFIPITMILFDKKPN